MHGKGRVETRCHSWDNTGSKRKNHWCAFQLSFQETGKSGDKSDKLITKVEYFKEKKMRLGATSFEWRPL